MGALAKYFGWVVILAMLSWAGCGTLSGGGPGEGTIPLQVLYKGSQCGAAGPAAGATWIDLPRDLPPALGRLESARWQADTEGALWIRMGSQPSGGYGLELANPEAIVRKGTATVRIDWRYPASDRFVTLAFTSPCILLKIPKAGLASIQVVDQEGFQRARVELP
jgi:hypothetical protein